METGNNTSNGIGNAGSNQEKLSTEKKHVYNFELNSFSLEPSRHFTKVHKRRFYAFGCGHEPGTVPGTGF